MFILYSDILNYLATDPYDAAVLPIVANGELMGVVDLLDLLDRVNALPAADKSNPTRFNVVVTTSKELSVPVTDERLKKLIHGAYHEKGPDSAMLIQQIVALVWQISRTCKQKNFVLTAGWHEPWAINYAPERAGTHIKSIAKARQLVSQKLIFVADVVYSRHR